MSVYSEINLRIFSLLLFSSFFLFFSLLTSSFSLSRFNLLYLFCQKLIKGWALLDSVCEGSVCGGSMPLMRDREGQVRSEREREIVCVCVCVCERERGTERERKTDHFCYTSVKLV